MRTVGYWAREWRVDRKTARAWLRDMHEKYGERVVERYGEGGRRLRASHESLQRVSKGPQTEYVTPAQLTRALGDVWKAIETLKGEKAWVRANRRPNGE